MTFILASTSPVRAEILHKAGIAFEARRPTVDEASLKRTADNLTPAELALHLARSKALSIAAPRANDIILGADQVLVCGGKVYDKPSSPAQARKHLNQLKGTEHQLISALSCTRGTREIWNHTGTARLTMRKFSDDFLDGYLRRMGDDTVTSVGAYKLEHEGIQLFEAIEGDYFTILGLPLLPLLAFLREMGEVPA